MTLQETRIQLPYPSIELSFNEEVDDEDEEKTIVQVETTHQVIMMANVTETKNMELLKNVPLKILNTPTKKTKATSSLVSETLLR
jgi:hypothetical protein